MNASAQTSARPLSGSKLDNRRVLAALIDLAIVGAGGAAILAAAGVLGGDGGSLGAPLAGVVVCWALYYYFACESGGGQTVGKRLTRLRVVRVDGRLAGMREVALRTVLRVIDTVLVGLIAMLATGERRARLGDLAGATMVVSTEGAVVPSVASAVATPAAIEVPEADDEPPAYDEEPAEVVESDPVAEYEPITRAEAEPVVEAEPIVEIAPAPQPRPLAEVEIGGPEIDVDDPQVTVRSVDTVSAIDLVMGADDPSEDRPVAGGPPAGA